MVSARKQTTHKRVRAQRRVVGPKRVPGPVSVTGCPDSNGQHHCGLLYKQRGWYEVRIPLCSVMEAPVMVQPQEHHTSGATYSRSPKHDCRQALSSQSGDPDRVVSSPGGLQPPLPTVALSRGGPVCNQIQQQAPKVCISSPGPSSLGRGCSKSLLGGSGPVCLSTNSPPGQCGEQNPVPRLQKDNPHRPRLAQHALVLGSSGAVSSGPALPASTPQSGGATVQWEPSQGSGRSEPSCLAPRVEAIKQQGFSDQVAARIEAPQRPSTRAIYEAKWALFVRWCQSNQVEFRSPSIKQVADLLLYLFQEK